MRPPPFPLPKAPAQADKAWLLGLLGGAVGHGLGETLRFATTGRLANLTNAVALGVLVVCVLLAGLAWQRRPATLRLLEAVFASAALLGLCQPLLQRADPGALVALWAAARRNQKPRRHRKPRPKATKLKTQKGILKRIFKCSLPATHAAKQRCARCFPWA
jgi:hypothetical protein